MEPLLSALTSLATALETDRALAQTIASMEHGLASALGAERVTIGVGEVSPSAPPGPRDETLPLVLDGKHVGTATFTFPRGPSDRERDYVRALAAPLALALAWRSHASERVRLSELVRTDGLTRLANRMAFDERLDAAWQSAAERRASVTLAILDIDYFKICNGWHSKLAAKVPSSRATAAKSSAGSPSRSSRAKPWRPSRVSSRASNARRFRTAARRSDAFRSARASQAGHPRNG
jgi:hypothetical protein